MRSLARLLTLTLLATSMLSACASKTRGPTERGVASFYHPSLAGNETANGETYDPDALTCAHRTLPFGTRVQVELLRTGATAVCRINDRGPYHDGRILDLSEGMARELGVAGDDIHRVEITVLK